MFKNLDYKAAHEFVNRTPGAFWEGWTLIQFQPNPKGATSKNGMYRNGKWGIAHRSEVNERGEWRVRVNTRRPRS